MQDMIFSFSQPVWDDMQSGRMVLQDDKDYIIVHFDNTESLPKGQRSVLLKNFVANIIDTIRVPKANIFSVDLGTLDHNAIIHFKKNRNNHTQSDWNCIRNTCYTRDIGARALCTEYLFYRAERRFDLKCQIM